MTQQPTENPSTRSPRAGRTKRRLGAALRLLVAVAGLVYIVASLDFQDSVLLPAGYAISETRTLDEPASAPVIEDDGDRLTLALGERQVSVAWDQIGTRNTQPQFQPGITTSLRSARLPLLLLGLLIAGGVFPVTAIRWWMLLRARRLGVPMWQAFRLTMVGCFFNYCMPGTTGGDVVKAWYAAKRPDRRAEAAMSVLVDRLFGLLGLAVLAGLVGLLLLEDPSVRRLTLITWLVLAGVAVAAMLFYSRRLRRWLRVEALLEKLPLRDHILAVDRALLAYRDHKPTVAAALAMGTLNHLLLALATATAGYALGMRVGLVELLAVVPILFAAAALPISYQGLGVMEAIALSLLGDPPAVSANQIVGMLLLIRLYLVIYSMGGALFLLKGDIHAHPATDQTMRRQIDEDVQLDQAATAAGQAKR